MKYLHSDASRASTIFEKYIQRSDDSFNFKLILIALLSLMYCLLHIVIEFDLDDLELPSRASKI